MDDIEPAAATDPLGVGILGCGQAAQALHLPALASLPDLFRVRHVADASGEVARDVAARVGAEASVDPADLIADPSVDVVLVATPDAYHARHAVDAVRAQKRAVLVEKPVALTPGEADVVVAESERHAVPVLIGTMHRYDPAFVRALPDLRRIAPEVVVMQTCYGSNDLFVGDQVRVRRGRLDVFDGEGPLGWLVAGTRLAGLDAPSSTLPLSILALALSCHDLVLLREVLGEPDQIDHVSPQPGNGYQMVLRYGKTPVIVIVHENAGRFQDWRLQWIGRHEQVEIAFPPSWGSSSPSSLRVHRLQDGFDHRTVDEGRYETGFRGEWRHVHDVVTRGAAPLTPARDAAADVHLVGRLVAHVAEPPATQPDAFGVAVLGAGWITAVHTPILDALPEADVRVVASRSLAAAERRAWGSGAEPATFTALDRVLARDDIDVVLVAGPPALHAEHTVAALEAGKHVIVEKPLAATLADADAIVEAEAASEGSVGYAENYTFMPHLVEATRLVADGFIGEVADSPGVWTLHGRPAWGSFLDPSWGGGCLFDMGPHTIWWLLDLYGHRPVASVRAVRIEGRPGEGDDEAELELTFGDGARSRVHAAWRFDGAERSAAEVCGTSGTLRTAVLPHAAIEVRRPGSDDVESVPWSNPYRGTVGSWVGKAGYRDQLVSFLATFRTGQTPAVGATRGRDVLEIICAGYASAAAGGTEVALPFTGPRDRTPYDLWRGGAH